MSFFNSATNEIHYKIIYCGPGLSGKTTNLLYVYEHTQAEQPGEYMKIGAETERTLFFDFLPLWVEEVRGMKTRLHLFSIPGQTFYETSRQFILKGVDGIVFVVDSRAEQMEENLRAYQQLERDLEQQGYDLHRLPLVFQYNKRDLTDAVPIRELEATFNSNRRPHFEAVASRGEGVMETLQCMSQQVIRDLKRGNQAE